jgi:ABC-type siderophore export system fused ATPase/permease subunit
MKVMTERFAGVSATVVLGMFFWQPMAAKSDAHNVAAVRVLRIQHITGSTLLFVRAFPIIHRRLLNPIIFDFVK